MIVWPAQMYVHCVSIAHEGQKGAPDTLELELLMAVSYHLGSRNGTGSSGRAVRDHLSCPGAIFLQLPF